MIIVRLQGRLGNQMFQYALAKSLQAKGKEVYIDSSMLKYDNNHNELGLFEETVSIPEATVELVAKYGDCNKSFMSKVKRKTLGYKKTHVREDGYQFHPELFDIDNVYLEGYWQTEKYFKEISEQIRKDFTFPEITEQSNKEIVIKINEENNPVSLHIRRGDYLQPGIAEVHGNICSRTYYDNAIEYIKGKYADAKFFVFTDDPNWAREEYKGREEFIIIDNNSGDKSFRDMQLMSLCKHNITANSSFSWWGAWLNKNQEKEVICPPKWFNTAETPDIWCEGWKVIVN